MTRVTPSRAATYAILAIMYLPIALLALQSLNSSPYIGVWEGLTLKWYGMMMGDERLHAAAYNSLAIAAASAVSSTLLGVAAGLAVRRHGKVGLVDAIMYPPLVLPEIAEAAALLLFLTALDVDLGLKTVVIGHTAFNIAYVYVVAAPALQRSSSLEDAARTLGATPARTLVTITIPLAAPAIYAGFTLAFILSFTDFIKTLFTRGPGIETIPILLWNRARRPGLSEFSSFSYLAAITMVLLAVSLAVALAYVILSTRLGGRRFRGDT
ncbi:spermidine/putrescine ABC transporter, permease protein [Aeropyrum pernix K1]|uniref:Spermidine/putrescine ABC transporter, permease protein n=1 Tax=Aeropyrum pernix (strain ATCC 700893 / DSM 11879 / JCM 9820 / NBRC 100138 / K1) TaxID=272557 RepID=Q9YDH2_AERPE|nr:ABC transporter permease [Aeropyrum pernix]BAA79925.1 spermidine/putrescine ABC transporter, permease protein [Aeropyrum pernix K1]